MDERGPARWIAQHLQRSTFLRFLVAGGINTLFGFVVYGAGILAGAPVWLALLIGMVAGTIFNFVTTGGYAFRQMRIDRYPRFVLCYLVLYGLNLVLIQWLSQWIANALAVQAVLLAPVALLSYFMMARLVFNRHD